MLIYASTLLQIYDFLTYYTTAELPLKMSPNYLEATNYAKINGNVKRKI